LTPTCVTTCWTLSQSCLAVLKRSDFHAYQNAMVERLLNPIADDTDNQCCWAGMGSGKTVVNLTVAQEFLEAKEVKKVLVVSTKKAAEHTWAEECTEWTHLHGLQRKVKLLFGTPDQREAKLGKGKIQIINQENLPWLVKGFGQDWPYDMVIIDDCKGYKTPGATTFRATRYVLPKIHRLYYLSGTPMPNGYLQLWPQLFVIDQGVRLGRTQKWYKERFFEQDYNGFKWHLRSVFEGEEIDDKLRDVAFSVRVEDHIDVPEILNPPPVLVHLSNKLRSQYKELEDEFYLALDEDTSVEALSVANLQNKLAQFCNGAVYTDPMDDTSPFHVVHDLKLDALEDVINETQGENLIIAFQFKSDWLRIKKRFNHAVHINEPKAVKRWNKGKIRLLCCHPASAGHGLNLQKGGRTILWFGAEWSLELNQQMDERVGAIRQAQSGLFKQPVYIRLAVANSVEQRIAEALRKKDKMQSDLTGKVKLEVPE